MAYVGNPQAAAFSSRPPKQDLTGASGTSLTLSHAVANAESIDLFINNVRQEPTTEPQRASIIEHSQACPALSRELVQTTAAF